MRTYALANSSKTRPIEDSKIEDMVHMTIEMVYVNCLSNLICTRAINARPARVPPDFQCNENHLQTQQSTTSLRGRVFKALDLSSNGRTSAWVRTLLELFICIIWHML
jgi:hypothetical protein